MRDRDFGVDGDTLVPDPRGLNGPGRTSNKNRIRQGDVALAHDAMAEEYDRLDDLWYPWLFARVHHFIAERLPQVAHRRPRALDAGCGTGFQSFLLARAGFDVDAFDIASDLVNQAERKSVAHAVAPLAAPPLFSTTTWRGANARARQLAELLECVRQGRTVHCPRFSIADLEELTPERDAYDVVTCCGSVLSFLNWPEGAIGVLASALRRHGRLFLEVEQKSNMDLIWPAVDRLAGGGLHYEQDWRTIVGNIVRHRGQHIRIDYPFELRDGSTVALPLRLFAVKALQASFDEQRLRVLDRAGIHWATGVFPSTLLHRPNSGRAVSRAAHFAFTVDAAFASHWPFWRLGCSVIYCLERR